MNVRHTLICFFFLSGNTGLITAEIIPVKEGGNITYRCKFMTRGQKKIFYKEDDLLIETEKDKAQYDRYSIEYEPATLTSVLYVSITNLTKSDSGKYRCVLKRDYLPDSVEEFELRVEDAGNTGLINAEIPIITGKEGGNITHGCKYFFSGSQRALYKEDDLLIETQKDKAQYDRYSIEYEPGTILSSPVMYVSITNLTKSDSGKYRCVLKRDYRPDSVEEFELRVEDAPTTLKPNWTPGPFPTSVPSTSTPTTTQSLISSSGSSTPSSVSPKTTHQSQQQQTAAGQDMLLYVGLTLVIMIFVLSAAVLIYCRKTNSKPKGPPQETEYVNVTEADRVYEEIREENRQSRSPSVEISTVHAHAKYSKPNAAEGTDDYSLVTAASSQMETEDDSSKLTYSVVDLSNGATAPLNSAPRGDADNVVYSVVHAAASSDDRHAEDASAPLYSAVTLHQQ